jgi:hypothetical protein
MCRGTTVESHLCRVYQGFKYALVDVLIFTIDQVASKIQLDLKVVKSDPKLLFLLLKF